VSFVFKYPSLNAAVETLRVKHLRWLGQDPPRSSASGSEPS
jgi:hypothetical protein